PRHGRDPPARHRRRGRGDPGTGALLLQRRHRPTRGGHCRTPDAGVRAGPRQPAGHARRAPARGRDRLRRRHLRPGRTPSLAARTLDPRGGQRRRRPARPARHPPGAADRHGDGRALRRRAGRRPPQPGAGPAPADGLAGRPDPVPRLRHAHLAAAVRRRRPGHRGHPQTCARAAGAWAGTSRMSRLPLPRAVRAAGLALLAILALGACTPAADQALGTLEYDRITLPAPAAERIASIEVREGERVEAGQRLLVLEANRGEAQLAASEAEVARQRQVLEELRNGARSEDIAQARANLAAAEAQARDARAYYQRVQPLGARQLVAAAEVDRARAAAGSADAQVAVARAALQELQNGARPEQVAQAEAALAAAEAQLRGQADTTGRLEV